MQGLPISFEFFSFNTGMSVLLIGIIPVIYVVNLWRKVKHEIIFAAFIGPLIAVEYLLFGLWFILTFPFWLFIEISIFLQSGALFLEGLWGIHGIIYIVYLVSLFVVPSWIKTIIERFTKTYSEIGEQPTVPSTLDTRRMSAYNYMTNIY